MLREELQSRWVERREVVVHLTAAAAEGDRSENAEYIYRKKQLREIDRRIRYLQKRIPELEPVDSGTAAKDKIFFGAWVTLCDENGGEVRHRIVGADETDPKKSWISVDAPLARALLGRRVDDEITLEVPKGKLSYWIAEIAYEES